MRDPSFDQANCSTSGVKPGARVAVIGLDALAPALLAEIEARAGQLLRGRLAKGCDLVLIVDAYHHFPDRPRYLERLAALLRPGGRLANIDWHKKKTAFGPPMDHRIAREDFLADAAKANLRLVAEPTFLPHQYFLLLAPR